MDVDAFAARGRLARKPRYASRPVLIVGGVAGALGAGFFLKAWWAAVGVAVFTVLASFPTLLYRGTSRRLVRDNPGLHGPATITVVEDGVHTQTTTSQAHVGWQRYQLYVETTASFVLLASDQPGAALQILPKRALAAPTDATRLRVLLDRYLHRAGPR
jgi:hypothetical protein